MYCSFHYETIIILRIDKWTFGWNIIPFALIGKSEDTLVFCYVSKFFIFMLKKLEKYFGYNCACMLILLRQLLFSLASGAASLLQRAEASRISVFSEQCCSENLEQPFVSQKQKNSIWSFCFYCSRKPSDQNCSDVNWSCIFFYIQYSFSSFLIMLCSAH